MKLANQADESEDLPSTQMLSAQMLSTQMLPCQMSIAPLFENAKNSPSVKRHTEEMQRILRWLLEVKGISHTDLEKYLPVIHWELCKSTPEIYKNSPGDISIYLLCKDNQDVDLAHFFQEMIERSLLPGTRTKILSSKHLSFRFLNHPQTSYFISEIFCFIDNSRFFSHIQKNMPTLAEEIALGIISKHHAQHILVTKGLSQEQKTIAIHKMIIGIFNKKFKNVAPDVFVEMHHFLLASDDDFKRLRDIRHMCRVICSHLWFRQKLKEIKSSSKIRTRSLYYKILPSKLHFQFGQKKVLALVIAVNFLRPYEKFEARHILGACRNILPNLQLVPHSFFSYQNSSDSLHSFYLEVEKKDGADISFDEIKHLRQGLAHELPLSIEHLSHKIFMPQNDEEVLRNILLLSKQIRYVRDIPQMIISFQGQSESYLTFHVTLVRVIKEKNELPLEKLFINGSDLFTFKPLIKKIVGYVRNKYPKETSTFLLECTKAPFMRQDHSIDLSRAREFIAAEIRKALGDVRDFNGGLIYQQNRLLGQVKELLSHQEKKSELYLENLFHSINPLLMRSLLAPELIKQLFELFLLLKKEKHSSKGIPRFRELMQKGSLLLLAEASNHIVLEEVNKISRDIGLADGEVASASFTVSGITYFGYIILSCNDTKIDQFRQKFDELFTSHAKTKPVPQSLKISLPRPTSLLDPRIGTDRTSGIVIKMFYEGLMRIDPCGKPTPAAALSVKVSPDEKTYTFTLRSSMWSNGKYVTAYDFEYAWKKTLDPNFRTLFAYLLFPVKNAKAIKFGQKPSEELGVVAKDALTLEVELEHPTPYFLELTAHWAYSPLCKEVDMLHPGWAYYGEETYVCNGPFRLVKWRRNSEIHAVKNSYYWDANSVKLEEIDISVVENPNIALSLYQNGELDWIGEPLSEIPPKVFSEKSFTGKIFSHPIAAIHWYACNVKLMPLASIKCRKALAIALNRQMIIDELLEGSEQPAYSILPSHLSLKKGAYFQDGNPELAKKLFLEGLEEQHVSFDDLSPFIITCLDQEIYKSCALATARQWREKLGIDVQVALYKWEQFIERYSNQDFQLIGTTWYSWFNDPMYNLNTLRNVAGEMNPTQWSNSEYVALLDEAQTCIDQKKRQELMRKAEAIAMKEMPIIPLFHYTFKYMKKDNVNNIYLSHLGQIDFKWASISQPEESCHLPRKS